MVTGLVLLFDSPVRKEQPPEVSRKESKLENGRSDGNILAHCVLRTCMCPSKE